MRRALLLAVPFALLAGVAVADDRDDTDCNNAMSQNEMNFCADKDYQAADKKLNAVYRKVVASLGDKAYETKLRAAERAWITFRDTQCTFETADNEGGSIHPMVYSGCITQKTKARTKELRGYLECQKDSTKCSNE